MREDIRNWMRAFSDDASSVRAKSSFVGTTFISNKKKVDINALVQQSTRQKGSLTATGRETTDDKMIRGNPTEADALLAQQHNDPEEDDNSEDSEGMFSKFKHQISRTLTDTLHSEQQQVTEIQEAFKDHLEEVNDVDDFFLTMALTKNLSLLPSKPEVEQAVEEAAELFHSLRHNLSFQPRDKPTYQQGTTDKDDETEYETSRDEDDNPEKAPPLSAYLTLGSAVCALSSIGPFLAKQLDVDATMKIVWRFQGTAILLAPFAIQSIRVDGIPNLTVAQWGTFFLAASSYAVLCVAFAMSIDYTTVANATILTNSQSVLLVAAKLVTGHQVVFLEGFGVLVAFLGGLLAAREAAGDEDAPAQGWWSVWGDCLGLISSIGGIGYIVLGKSLRAHFPVLLFMVLNMLTASFIILVWMWMTGKDISWDMDTTHGVFGWMDLQFDRLPLEIMTVFVCNVLGTLGYVRSFKYFSSVIIAVAALLEPVVAAFTATAMGVGVLPGVEGWIGNILVILGTIAVLYPTTEQGRAEKERKVPKTPRTPYPRMKSPGFALRPPMRDVENLDEDNGGVFSHVTPHHQNRKRPSGAASER